MRPGADRYPDSRHETAGCRSTIARLHPAELTQEQRMQCSAGSQGDRIPGRASGLMVGIARAERPKHLGEAICACSPELQPAHGRDRPVYYRIKDTPLSGVTQWRTDSLSRMVAILRHLFPEVLLPATTALGTIHPSGRGLGVFAPEPTW